MLYEVITDLGLRPGAVIDGFEVQDPVRDDADGEEDQDIVEDPHDYMLRFVQEEDEDEGDETVDPPVILGGGRFQHRGIGVDRITSYNVCYTKLLRRLLSFQLDLACLTKITVFIGQPSPGSETRSAVPVLSRQFHSRHEVVFHVLDLLDAGHHDLGIDLEFLLRDLVLILDLGQDIFDAINPRFFLVVGTDDGPGRNRNNFV